MPSLPSQQVRPSITYVCDRFPALTQTFVRDEVRALHARGLVPRVYSLHPRATSDPQLDAADGDVHVLPVPWAPEVVAALLSWLVRRPLLMVRLLVEVLNPRSVPPRFGIVFRGPLHLAWAAWLAQRLSPTDHLHVHFLTSGSTVAWLASLLSGCSFSFTAHSEWGMPNLRAKLDAASLGLVVSAHEKARLLALAPRADPQRLLVCHLGTPLADIPGPASPAPDRAGVRVACVGTFGPTKGQDVLVRAVSILVGEGLDVHLDLVGDGPSREAVELDVERLDLRDRVTFHGALPHEAALDVVRRAQIGALACRRTPDDDVDGIPVVLMESMAMGRATVSTTVGGIPELITDGVTGRLVAPDDPEAFASALRELVRDPARRAALASAGRRHVEQHHSARKAHERVGDILVRAADDQHLSRGRA